MLNLKQIRERNNLSISDLAKKLGVSTVCVWRWEVGQREPSLKRLVQIAEMLNSSLDDLLGIEVKS